MNTIDSERITFEKQNLPFEVDVNTATPHTELVDNKDVLLSFRIQGTDGEAKIIFKNCRMYRVGSPNDEAFCLEKSNNDSMYSSQKFPGLEFDYLYKVNGYDWSQGLVGEKVTFVSDFTKDNLNHYVFFMKDGTFECVAEEYEVIKI